MKKTKLILTTLIIMLAIILLNTSEVNASLQANSNTHYQKDDHATNWMTNFRKMEEQGEGMGLSETLNDDLTASSESNNIDVHMIKTTEYGARPLRRAIQNIVEDSLAEYILDGKIKAGEEVKIAAKDGKIIVK